MSHPGSETSREDDELFIMQHNHIGAVDALHDHIKDLNRRLRLQNGELWSLQQQINQLFQEMARRDKEIAEMKVLLFKEDF